MGFGTICDMTGTTVLLVLLFLAVGLLLGAVFGVLWVRGSGRPSGSRWVVRQS